MLESSMQNSSSETVEKTFESMFGKKKTWSCSLLWKDYDTINTKKESRSCCC